MDIVKKNLVSVLCGVIAVVCVVLIYFPLGGMYSAMTDDVKKSKKVGDDLAAVRNAQRHWPTLSTKEEDKQPLRNLPTDPLNQVGQKITEDWKATTETFLNNAVVRQQNALKPLVPGLLPKANGRFLPLQFAAAYANLFGIDLNTAGAGATGGGGGFGGGFGGGERGVVRQPGTGLPVTSGPPKPLLDTPLVGRTPPSNEEIKAKADEREAVIRREKLVLVNGVPQNEADVVLQVAKARAAIGDQLVDEVARGSMIYVDPAVAFDSQKNVVGINPPDDDTVFLAQAGLWLQQEICRGIYQVNKPALDAHKDAKGQLQGVLVAPIKHLIGVRLALPFAPPPAPAAGTAAPTDVPVLPATPPAAKVPSDFVKNPLGQASNDLYDVLPFTMVVVCDADTLPQTLAEFTRGRYLSVRSVDVQAVDAAVAQANRLLYGTKPVVQVSVRGQYLMMRKFLGPFMPANIIRGILNPSATPGAPGAPAGAPGMTAS